jgi:acetyl-CoA acetyltransferase family protein
MREVVIVDGIRTPYVKAGTVFRDLPAQELGRIAVQELIERTGVDPETIDEVVIGNIAQPPEATNVARVIALKSGIPRRVPAVTVARNCASGMEAIANAHLKIAAGMAEVAIAGGVESMSNIPILYPPEYAEVLAEAAKAKSLGERINAFSHFRPKHFKPVIGLQVGLTDPVCDLNMGETAEVLAKEFGITRQEQDAFALMSHQRATMATDLGKIREEIVPVFPPPKYNAVVDEDNGIRKNQTMEALAKLRPVFDRDYGSVTAGNSSQITDGAAAVLMMSAEAARAQGRKILGYVRGYAFAGLDPARMGLGPAVSTPRALKLAGVSFKDIQLLEINEAFAAQVIANELVFRDAKLSQNWIGREEPIGEINREILNVNGGAIALGHPVGSSGTRLILTLLKEMQRRDLNLGLATLCVGGGQGGAMVVERK